MKDEFYKTGKLPQGVLDTLLQRYTSHNDPLVIVGPGIGRDAAVIDTGGDEYMVLKADPITFATDQIGRYALAVNANDIACMGGRPRWFLPTVLLPENRTDDHLVEDIFRQLSEAASEMGISIVGGHTEITYDLNRPVIAGLMVGTVGKEKLIRDSMGSEGDLLILTKAVAVEGTSLIAREKGKEVLERFGEEFLERAKGFLFSPGISVVRDAEIAISAGGVKGLHDPTEGGLATGIHEIARSSGVGFEIWKERIPVYNETGKLSEYFGIDPLGLIASGSLLILAKEDSADRIINALKKAGIRGTVIGRAVKAEEGVTVIEEGKKKNLPLFVTDEITKLL
ncbi:MAG: hydrogenase expression/formation protein [Nitrospirae bacterium]|nr:MAG: hydrogenase expression/formation protein [Nitrospirota bacterium]